MAFINKHTGGKWEVLPLDKNNSELKIKGEYKDVAEVYIQDQFNKDIEAIANAKLIAASPKLRQIAEMFYDTLDEGFVKDLVRETLIEAGVEITNLKQVENG